MSNGRAEHPQPPGPLATSSAEGVTADALGGGNVNGIRSIAGGLGIAAIDNKASFITQLQARPPKRSPKQ
jgi:hypothetical protein